MGSWNTADRIVVELDSSAPVATITDKAVILQTSEFVQAHVTGWEIPWAGTPVARLTLDFYHGTHFLGHLGIEQRLLEAQGCDDFVTRSISSDERRSLTHLLGVSDDFTRR
jgi:opacity protein-like surface antigen